eukprot:COSAG01_NODE_6909_length_3443_cov_13.005981_2_plen_97_part_00
MTSLVGATTPLFFELGAEVTFPSNEGVSAGLISGMLNLGGLVLLVRPAPPNACWMRRRSAHSAGGAGGISGDPALLGWTTHHRHGAGMRCDGHSCT